MSMLKRKCAQSISEYVALVLAIVSAIYAMQTYYRRGIQAKLRDMFVSVGLGTQQGETIDERDAGVVVNENSVSRMKEKSFSNFRISQGRAIYVGTTSSTYKTIEH